MLPSNLSIFNSDELGKECLREVNETSREMRRFAIRCSIFLIPFLLYGLAITLIDPFQLWQLSSLISEKRKAPIAEQMNGCIWKMNQFRRHPVKNIILGDSRMNAISVQDVRQITGQEYFNFSYGGASLNEIIDSFWFATRHAALERVYIGLNLNVYNDYNNSDRAALFNVIEGQPVLYFFNRVVVEAAYYDILSVGLQRDLKLVVPEMSRQEFWAQQLGQLTAAYYSTYMTPVRYRQRLAEISAYARDHHIDLTFVIPPTHVSLQQRVQDFHLQSANLGLRDDLRRLGMTIDFDQPNELTRAESHFRDPYHLRQEFEPLLVREIWGNGRRYGTR